MYTNINLGFVIQKLNIKLVHNYLFLKILPLKLLTTIKSSVMVMMMNCSVMAH
jgi:hypothetical protein